MPMKPKKPCKHPGCPRLTGGQYCKLHATLHAGDRASAFERGYGNRWQIVRKQFLAKHFLCIECERSGKLTPANVVDHIHPHRGESACVRLKMKSKKKLQAIIAREKRQKKLVEDVEEHFINRWLLCHSKYKGFQPFVVGSLLCWWR